MTNKESAAILRQLDLYEESLCGPGHCEAGEAEHEAVSELRDRLRRLCLDLCRQYSSITRISPTCAWLTDGTKVVIRRPGIRGKVWLEVVKQARIQPVNKGK